MPQDNNQNNELQDNPSEKERVQRLINTEFLRLQKVRRHRYFLNNTKPLASQKSIQIDDIDMIDRE